MKPIKELYPDVEDYTSMLGKLSMWSFFVTTICIIILYAFVPSIRTFFDAVTPIKPLGFEFPVLLVVPGIVAGILSNAVPLHDVLSKIFWIRDRFDVNHILLPLAAASGVTITPALRSKIEPNRRVLVRQVFYQHVSSKSDQPSIDRHLIHKALNTWSWYWVLLEAQIPLLISVAILYATENPKPATVMLFTSIGSLCMLKGIYNQCIANAADEVSAILEDPGRALTIRKTFDDL